MEDKFLTVTALNKYIKYKFDSDDNLKLVFLKGEISNMKFHTNGHLYFTIKDETSKINAVMFANSLKKIVFEPKDGIKVLITGKVGVYEANGNYQVYVDDMQEDGLGDLHIAFEKLKIKLANEGLFEQSHKRPIPKIPSTIGIITASTGAAVKDILSTLNRRFPLAKTILFPSLVQGNLAAPDIVSKIELANTYDIDVLIVGRGGGSIEDLWAFNEEIVARAIYNSKIPIISAVGHEIDYTISDFVADMRAPTPTAAAELVAPNYLEIVNQVNNYKVRANSLIKNVIDNLKLQLLKLQDNYILKNPLNIYQNKQLQIDSMVDSLNNIIQNKLSIYKNKYNYLIDNYILKNPLSIIDKKKTDIINKLDKLEVLNPLNTLKRGYAIVEINDKVISSIKKAGINDKIKITLNDGYLDATIEKIGEK